MADDQRQPVASTSQAQRHTYAQGRPESVENTGDRDPLPNYRRHVLQPPQDPQYSAEVSFVTYREPSGQPTGQSTIPQGSHTQQRGAAPSKTFTQHGELKNRGSCYYLG